MTTPCYVFDIDGTIADGDHRLHHIVREAGDARPKNWRAFFSAAYAASGRAMLYGDDDYKTASGSGR